MVTHREGHTPSMGRRRAPHFLKEKACCLCCSLRVTSEHITTIAIPTPPPKPKTEETTKHEKQRLCLLAPPHDLSSSSWGCHSGLMWSAYFSWDRPPNFTPRQGSHTHTFSLTHTHRSLSLGHALRNVHTNKRRRPPPRLQTPLGFDTCTHI